MWYSPLVLKHMANLIIVNLAKGILSLGDTQLLVIPCVVGSVYALFKKLNYRYQGQTIILSLYIGLFISYW